MSACKSNLNKAYSFYCLTFRWLLSAWSPWHLTGKGWSTGSLDFCSSPLWSCALLCALPATASSLRSSKKDRDLRWWDSEEQDLQEFASLWAVLCCQQDEQFHEFLSWAMPQLHSWLLFFFFFPQPTLLCCNFNSKLCSHDTHMLFTLMTNRRSVCGLLNIPSSALIFWLSAANLIPSYAQMEELPPATAWAGPRILLCVLLHSRSITTALILKGHKSCIYKGSFLGDGSLHNPEAIKVLLGCCWCHIPAELQIIKPEPGAKWMQLHSLDLFCSVETVKLLPFKHPGHLLSKAGRIIPPPKLWCCTETFARLSDPVLIRSRPAIKFQIDWLQCEFMSF